jgi:hypothetical protein
VAVAVGLALLTSLCGCTFIAGDPPAAPRPTLGRELRDLKTAHEDGALSDDEYSTAKQRLMSSYDKR